MEKRTGAAQRNRQTKQPQQRSNARRIMIIFGAIFAVMIIGVGCGFLTATFNTKADLADIRPPASSQIYDINGNEIANVHADENRVPVKMNQIPENLKNAFVAVEDVRFYEHSGIDFRGIMRAAWSNITNQGVSEGGSTITQQLAKNAYLTQDRTFKRKIQEMFLAIQLEHQYTKQEILELYLNQIYFGQGAYGVQAAAKTYFGKSVEELDLSECAMLAGIPKSPNYYSPMNNLKAAQARKATVLDQMAKYGYISTSTASKTKGEELRLVKNTTKSSGEAAYFVDYVIQMMIEKYGSDAVYKEGLKIYTTLDMDMQRAAEEAMKNLPDMSEANGIKQPQGALVAIDPHTGHIKAMVGGRGTDMFNRATQAERQPGSAFKPFVFAAALESNFTPSSIIDDKPLEINGWEPQNYSRNFNGKVSLRYVAEQSLNVPTVRVAQDVGIDKVIYYGREMGISTFVTEGDQNDGNLATALGGLTRGVTPLELTSAYCTFANDGIHVEHTAIIRVLDRNGKPLEEPTPKSKQVLKKSTVNDLTSMLMGVVARGTGTAANIGRPAAGKTGTTSDYHDAWFMGYVPDLVVGVWIGTDDNQRMGTMTGGTTPAVIWKAFMTKVMSGMPNKSFDGAYLTSVEKPTKIESVDKDGNLIDKDGKLILDKNGKPIKGNKKTSGDKNTADKQNKNNESKNTGEPAVPTPTANGGKKSNG
ncbi:MAG: penicillin-binding protein 1A [Anaerovibrio sp.]|uniref:transglycosylase domain-containing protein n=1 Tax=Anaerovibrio sp. TaxID=1872532 RepID=UPI0025CD4D91|nr:penicillin-binding protein 1A [Anaerovibrio sp.]MCR5175449.1 penicillin-binding protein 1A [Anaerovibrio sp.]